MQVCLKTGEFRPRVKEDYCSMCSPYDYHKDEDKVVHTDIKRIIKEICNDDDDHTNSILNWFGYCLTGCVDAQKYMYFIGQEGMENESFWNSISNALRSTTVLVSYKPFKSRIRCFIKLSLV